MPSHFVYVFRGESQLTYHQLIGYQKRVAPRDQVVCVQKKMILYSWEKKLFMMISNYYVKSKK